MLKAQDAADIYKFKISLFADLATRSIKSRQISVLIRGRSGPVAMLYAVTARTIRDIWTRRTWAYATEHLWPTENRFLRKLNLSDNLLVRVT